MSSSHHPDRRRLRSNQLRKSLQLLFESAARQHQVRALALADDNDTLVVGVSERAGECEALAACASTLAAGHLDAVADDLVASLPGLAPSSVGARALEADGERLVLVAAAMGAPLAEAAWRHVLDGIVRIMAEHRQA